MKKASFLWGASALVMLALALPAGAQRMRSPSGLIAVDTAGAGFSVAFGHEGAGREVLHISRVGLEMSDGAGRGLVFERQSKPRRVTADYRMVAGKRLHCTNKANEYVRCYRDAGGRAVRLVMRVYDDGVAFRYEFDGLHGARLSRELTTYDIPDGTRRWFMPWSDAYEGFYKEAVSSGGKRRRWAFPALFEAGGGTFCLLTEAGVGREQSAASLWNDADSTRFCVRPDDNPLALSGQWHTPWRVIIVGGLDRLVASTLVTDVSEPPRIADTQWIRPGVVSWIYWAYNHGSNDLGIIRQYIDMAKVLGLPYMLIDAEWDEMKDGASIDDAIRYAHAQGVRPMIWYNSSTGWIDGAPGPQFRLNDAERREREFAWLEQKGVAGVKIDFFAGDSQPTMAYCLDLLECAARHRLLVNFHGATIPRGWQRTWPNLLSTEAVYGAEWYNNAGVLTDAAPWHNATLPFTRNIVGSMDYTPCTFSDSQHPHTTTDAHELALTVLFESGLQHLADRPESYLAQPEDVRRFLGNLPSVWDETRLVGGYPARDVVIARRSGKKWYVAGINGTDSVRTLSLPLDFIRRHNSVSGFIDSDTKAMKITAGNSLPASVACAPRGGFVYVVE